MPNAHGSSLRALPHSLGPPRFGGAAETPSRSCRLAGWTTTLSKSPSVATSRRRSAWDLALRAAAPVRAGACGSIPRRRRGATDAGSSRWWAMAHTHGVDTARHSRSAGRNGDDAAPSDEQPAPPPQTSLDLVSGAWAVVRTYPWIPMGGGYYGYGGGPGIRRLLPLLPCWRVRDVDLTTRR